MERNFQWPNGDNIKFEFANNSGNQPVNVTLDPNNTGVVRSKQFYFKTTPTATIARLFTITQQPEERSYSQGYSAGYK